MYNLTRHIHEAQAVSAFCAAENVYAVFRMAGKRLFNVRGC